MTLIHSVGLPVSWSRNEQRCRVTTIAGPRLLNSFAMSVLAALPLRLKMGAEETSVIWLNRYAEQ